MPYWPYFFLFFSYWIEADELDCSHFWDESKEQLCLRSLPFFPPSLFRYHIAWVLDHTGVSLTARFLSSVIFFPCSLPASHLLHTIYSHMLHNLPINTSQMLKTQIPFQTYWSNSVRELINFYLREIILSWKYYYWNYLIFSCVTVAVLKDISRNCLI